MRYEVEYETRLAFPEPVREHHGELRVTPMGSAHQELVSAEVETEPASQVGSYVDGFGNCVHFFDLAPPHERLRVRMRAVVETRLENPFGFAAVSPSQERRWIEQQLAGEPRLLDYVVHRSAAVPPVEAHPILTEAPAPVDGKPLLDAVVAARDWIAARLVFDAEAPSVRPALCESLSAGTGTAADTTHALIAVVRSWGVPARYVAGYQDVEEDISPGPFAWAEVLIPGAGWRGFDVVNGLVVNDHYVAVAIGRDAADAVPFKSVFKGEKSPDGPSVQVLLRGGSPPDAAARAGQ